MEHELTTGLAVANLPRQGVILDEEYCINEELGRGSFGVVFEATQLPLDRRVAIKMLKPQSVLLPGVQERFLREARLVSALRSRYTVKVFSFGTWAPRPNLTGLPYMVMEYLEGEGLDAYIQRKARLSVRETVHIIRQVLMSLVEAHDKGIIHRDIKPENLFLSNEPGERVVKVLDFGIARAVSGEWSEETLQRLTRTGIICGTPAFMAPEQATGAPDLTPSIDLYSVGCIAFLLLTGRLPYPGYSPTTMAYGHVSEPIPALPPPLDGTPLAAVLRKAMAKKPPQRFRTAQEFINELNDCSAAMPDYFREGGIEPDFDGVPADRLERAPTMEFPDLASRATFQTNAVPSTPTTMQAPALQLPAPGNEAGPPGLHPTTVLPISRNVGFAVAGLIVLAGLIVAGVILITGLNRNAAPASRPLTAAAPTQTTPAAAAPEPAAPLEPPDEANSVAIHTPEPKSASDATPDERPDDAPPTSTPSAATRRQPAATRRAAPTSAASTPERAPAGKPTGQLFLACAQPDLTVFIDGGGPYPCNRATPLRPGDYSVRAHARGQEIRRVVSLKPGTDARVVLSIE